MKKLLALMLAAAPTRNGTEESCVQGQFDKAVK